VGLVVKGLKRNQDVGQGISVTQRLQICIEVAVENNVKFVDQNICFFGLPFADTKTCQKL
jgi:hypothetical protein